MPPPCLISVPLACFPWSCFLIHKRLAFLLETKSQCDFPSLYGEGKGGLQKMAEPIFLFSRLEKNSPSHTDGAMGKLHALFLLPSGAHAAKPWWSLGWPWTLPKSWWPPALNEASCFVCCPLNKSPLQQLLYFSLQTEHANFAGLSESFKPSLAKMSYCWLLSKVACIKATSLCCCFLHQ